MADNSYQIIAPGSQTTLAQLGLPESFTPARLRIPTRMFPAPEAGKWEPTMIREKRRDQPQQSNGVKDTTADVQMTDADKPSEDAQEQPPEEGEEEDLYEEDLESDEGAVYPIVEGKVVNWSCLFGLLAYVYNKLSPPFHTPALVLSEPSWTSQDHESITKFFFEHFKIPAFCLMDKALAVSYAYATQHATVVDVGYGKCDITTISDHIVNENSKASSIPGCGGEAMTQRLLSLLSPKGFNRDMCEQLKKNPICEVLPPGTELPADQGPEEVPSNPAAAASTGADGSGDAQRGSIAAQSGQPRGPGTNTEVGEADLEKDNSSKAPEDDEGVLDVANIVASGKTSEFLARKEKEKADKASKKKEAQIEAAAQRVAKMPNSKKARATFQYLERRSWEELNEPAKPPAPSTSTTTNTITNNDDTADPIPPATDTDDNTNANTAPTSNPPTPSRKESRRRTHPSAAYIRTEVEIGPERFGAADTTSGILARIADSIHRCILSVPEGSARAALWDSLIVVGNGAKVKGFKEALVATLNAKYLISPNSATIFTSELPSNFSTPVATGANTPQPQSQAPHAGAAGGIGAAGGHHPSGVNPLLHAATTASLAVPGREHPHAQMTHYQAQHTAATANFSHPQSQHHPHQQQHAQHSRHAQTPTSIRLLKAPEYFPEWKEYGMEEACFLGAQVAAKVVFMVDQGLSKGFMTRTEYNEMGPPGIHENCP